MWWRYVYIPDNILLESLIDFVFKPDGTVLREAVGYQSGSTFPTNLRSKLIDILSKLECSEIPTPLNLKALLTNSAKCQFLVKPFGLLYAMQSEVLSVYYSFWEDYSIEEMFNFYQLLNATPSSVLNLIEEPELNNAGESRVYNCLLSFVRNMKQKELRLFLRFVTGSSVLLY